MKTIKALQITLAILVLTVLVGCRDEIVSSPPQGPDNKKELNAEQISSNNIFQAQIKIQPGQVETFNHLNTGFYTFNSISILNCPEKRNILEITGSMDDELLLLECSSKGFSAKSIFIRNKSSNTIEVNLILRGSKDKIKGPGNVIKKFQ